MAIIKCMECGKEISDQTEACIHCGFKNPNQGKKDEPKVSQSELFIQNETNTETIPEEKRESFNSNLTPNNQEFEEKTKKNIGSTIGIICGIIGLIIIVIIIINLNTVKIPILYNVSQSNAETILRTKELVPTIEYVYDDYVEEGNVVDTFPYSDERVSKNDIVTIYISKGPRLVDSKDSTIEWYHIDYYKEDDWDFYSPYIEEGYLYIKCETTFSKSFNWKSSGEEGFGDASINDTFDKRVPLTILYDNKNVSANTKQNITLKISVNDLDVKKPTTLYTMLVAEENGKQFDIRVNFTISW